MKTRKVKISVNSPTESKAVQEFLFKDGCKWASGGTGVSYTKSKCMFVNEVGEITMACHRDDYYNDHEYEELKFKFNTTVSATPVERPKIMVFGKTYDKAEFEAAISKLTAI